MLKVKPLLSCEVSLDKIRLPVFISTKLDGLRAVVIDSVVYSRSLKPIRNKYVQKLFGKPEYNGMDGELVVGDVYAKDVFQKTTSGVMSAEGEPDVKFYVFDICNRPEETFTARRFILHNKLKNLPSDSKVVMLQQHYVETLYDLQQYLEGERIKGGEGLICRNPDGKYKYGRSTPKEQLSVKLKFFSDSEFKVVGFEELHSNTNEQTINELGYLTRSTHKQNQIPMGILGSLVLEFGDLTFKVGSGFTMEQRSEIWKNQHSYLGKFASVRYMEVGVKQLPRCPTFKGWRDIDDLGRLI